MSSAPEIGRRVPCDTLDEDRDEVDRPEHAHCNGKPGDVREGERPIAPEMERQDWLPRARFDDDEGRERDCGGGVQPEDLGRSPGVLGAAPDGREKPGGQPDRECDDAGVVDRVRPADVRHVHERHDEGEGEQPQRHVYEEQPAPARVVGQVAADERPDDRREPEDGSDQALVLAPLTGRHDVPDDGRESGIIVPIPIPWTTRPRIRASNVGASPLEDRADQEDDDAADVERLATVQVGQLARDRDDDRRGDQRRDGDPAVVLEAAKLGDDPRHRGCHDRLADRGQEHPEHEPGEDPPNVRGGEGRGGAHPSARASASISVGRDWKTSTTRPRSTSPAGADRARQGQAVPGCRRAPR